MSAATWAAVSVTLDMVTDVAMDIIVDRAFAPTAEEHILSGFEMRLAFADDEAEMCGLIRVIDLQRGLNWGEQQ